MYSNELLKSLKIDASGFFKNNLFEKLEVLEADVSKGAKRTKGLEMSKMQVLLKYNIETMLELKCKTRSVENKWIDDIKIENLRAAVDVYMDKYTNGQEEQKRFIKIISVYLTFIANKPLHPRGFFDPAGKVVFRAGNIVCPVKAKEINEDGSLCRFCVSSM
jgi:uncharacterized protein (UPF0305 family)